MATTAKPLGSDIVTTTAFELIALGLVTLLAGVNDQAGSVLVIVMIGFLIGWLFLHSSTLASWMPKAG